MNKSQFQGCLLGLALGDALCAPYEGGWVERSLWHIIGKTKDGKHRFTDDTQMAMDVVHSLLANGGVNQDHMAEIFAQNYRWSRGYGPSASKILKKIWAGQHWSKVNRLRHPQGSFGNGAAMRCAPIALFYAHQPEHLEDAVIKASEITHAHPLGIEGAQLMARIVYESLHSRRQGKSAIAIAQSGLQVCRSDRFLSKIRQAIAWLTTSAEQPHQSMSPQHVRQVLGNGMAATTSCVTAVYVGLAYRDRPFLELIDFVQQVGGDTDTIAAMAGAIWGSDRGLEGFAPSMIDQLEQGNDILQLGSALYSAHPH